MRNEDTDISFPTFHGIEISQVDLTKRRKVTQVQKNFLKLRDNKFCLKKISRDLNNDGLVL